MMSVLHPTMTVLIVHGNHCTHSPGQSRGDDSIETRGHQTPEQWNCRKQPSQAHFQREFTCDFHKELASELGGNVTQSPKCAGARNEAIRDLVRTGLVDPGK